MFDSLFLIFQGPLFPPFSDRMAAQFQVRKEVPLLDNAPYPLYQKACSRLVTDWLNGKIGEGAPTEDWEKQLISEAVDARSLGHVQSETKGQNEDEEVSRIYDGLVEHKVLTHLRTATSHRKWIRLSHEFCKLSGVSFSGDMDVLIRKHDLSKYTPEEMLGYAVMFGDAQVGWKKLDTDAEKNEWNNALEHHYVSNPHHPEYFSPKQADGQREKISILKATENGKLYLEESLIDMLGSRGERNLKDDSTISHEKWMDISDVYLKRYEEEDKKYVQDLLKQWNELGKAYVANEENADRLKTLFGRSFLA